MSERVPERLRDTGVTYRQLDYWVRKGHLVAPARGTGDRRKWTDEELDVARRIYYLVNAGLKLEMASKIARSPVGTEVKIGPHVTVKVE